jgi:hypothetical protein
VTVRSGSTWVVDLACELTYQSSGNGVTRGLGSSVLDHRFAKSRYVVGRQIKGGIQPLDLVEGWISESGIHKESVQGVVLQLANSRVAKGACA